MCSSFPGLLIGRTAVHSGKDPAFVAYDQFLSTGILQPLSRGEVRCGSKPVKLGTSKCFQVCPRKRTYLPILELLPPPAVRERCHRGLARRLIWDKTTIFCGSCHLWRSACRKIGSKVRMASQRSSSRTGRALLIFWPLSKMESGFIEGSPKTDP